MPNTFELQQGESFEIEPPAAVVDQQQSGAGAMRVVTWRYADGTEITVVFAGPTANVSSNRQLVFDEKTRRFRVVRD
jgi:hypothetical protein